MMCCVSAEYTFPMSMLVQYRLSKLERQDLPTCWSTARSLYHTFRMVVFSRPLFQPIIPEELIDRTLRYLDITVQADRQALYNTLCAHRRLHAIVTPILFRSVTVDAAHHSSSIPERIRNPALNQNFFDDFTDFLKKYPLVTKEIQELTLRGGPRRLSETVIPPWSVVDLPICLLTEIIALLPSLSTLSLHHVGVFKHCSHTAHHEPITIPQLDTHTPYSTLVKYARPIEHLILHSVVFYRDVPLMITTTTTTPSTIANRRPQGAQPLHLAQLVTPRIISFQGVVHSPTFGDSPWRKYWQSSASALYIRPHSWVILHQMSGITGLRDLQAAFIKPQQLSLFTRLLNDNARTLEKVFLGLPSVHEGACTRYVDMRYTYLPGRLRTISG